MLSPLSLILLLIASVVAYVPPPMDTTTSTTAQSPFALVDGVRVPVLLGVMSRCSDTILCESVFDDVLQHTWGIVDITLSFVGKLNDDDPVYGVTCMHGVDECRGNVQELCAMNRAHSQQDWWHFVQCLNFEGKDNVGSPALAERCAGLAYIPWEGEEGMKSCVESGEGRKLLRASVRQTESLGIEKSCTIMISGKTRCVRDGTWKNCETGHSMEEIVAYIQDEYQRLNAYELPMENP